MTTTSADPARLHDYDEGAGEQISALDELRLELQTRQGGVMQGSPSAGIHPRALDVLYDLLVDGTNTATWVRAIREALLGADGYDGQGVASISDRALAEAIGEGPPAVQAFQIQPLVFTGVPQTSGYVDDPVNAWTGNFVHGETDLRIHGASVSASVHRMYNSAAASEPGVFGLGWTSVLDMTVTADAAGVLVRLPDGAHLPFTADASDPTTLRCPWRRHVRLLQTAAGWELRDGSATTWVFDAQGALVAGVGHDHRLAVTRSADRIEVTDALTHRNVSYDLHDGLVRAAVTGDGRRSAYRHDGAGRLVEVSAPAGGHRYDLDDAGRIAAVIDADGVELVRNTYDADGRVTSQESQHGRMTSYTYTAEGVTTVADTEEDGGRNVLVHDRRGNLLAVFDGEGHAVRRTYDQLDRVTSVSDRRGNVTTYAWDDADNMVRRQTADGAVTTWEHDHMGRVTAVVDAAGVRTTLSYRDDLDIPVTATTPAGRVTVDLDDRGRPTEITDPDAVTRRMTWTDDSLIASIIDGDGPATTFTYDSHGQLVSAISAEGVQRLIDVDAAGRLTALHSADGVERIEHTAAGRIAGVLLTSDELVRFTHDDRGRLQSISRGGGISASFVHDRFGSTTEVHDPMGGVHRTAHDLVGRLTQVTDRGGNETLLVHDADGHVVQVHTPDGRSWSREVDVHGRTTSLTGPDGAVQQRTYHPGGQLASVTDPLGHLTRYEVDDAGRTVAQIDALGRVTRWTHTPAGRIHSIEHPGGLLQIAEHDGAGTMTGIIDADGSRKAVPTPWDGEPPGGTAGDQAQPASLMATYGIDSRGLLAQVSDPAGITTQLTRDLLGQITGTQTGEVGFQLTRSAEGWLVGSSDALGRHHTIERDQMGRPLALMRPDGSGRRQVLDLAGRVARVVDLGGMTLATHRHDAAGRLLGGTAVVDGVEVTIERELDALGRLISSTDPSGTTRHEYDEAGRLLRRTDPDGMITTVRRGTDGRVTAHVIDHAGEVSEILSPLPAAELRDAFGRTTVDQRGQTFLYDEAGRIAQAVAVDGSKSVWHYDELGRLASEERHDADGQQSTRRYDHDLTGRLTAVHDVGGTTRVLHDAAGRRTEEQMPDGGRRQFRFDEMDHLVEVTTTTPEGITSARTIQWDVLGRPVRVDDVAIGYDEVVSGKPVRVGDRRFLRQGLHTREVGAERWDDGRGEDPWGADRAGDGISLGFRGELVVDGLVLMGARVYDPATRVFLSIDPLPAVPGRLCHAAPHAYAEHDPVNMVDPTGLRPLSESEMRDYLSAQERNIFEAAGHAIAEDPWGFVLAGSIIVAGGILVVASGGTLLPLVGMGIVAGGVGAGLTGAATRSLNADSVIFGSVVGGATGPLTGPLSGWTGVAAETGLSVPVNVVDHTVVQGRPISEINPRDLLVGAVVAGGVRRTGDILVPPGAGVDAPSGPRPAPPTTSSMGSEFGDAPLRTVDAPPPTPRPALPTTGAVAVDDLPVFGPPSNPTMTPLPSVGTTTTTGTIRLPSGLLIPQPGLLVPPSGLLVPPTGLLVPSPRLWVPGDPG